jgi:hypothetical protein
MAEMKAYDPTTREKHAEAIQSRLEKLGMNRARARSAAQSIVGGASSGLPLGLGLADLTPMGLLYGGEEAGRMVAEGKDALARGDTAGGLLNTALGTGSAALMAMGPVGKLSGAAMSKFGGKAAREAKLVKKVAKAAAAEAAPDAVAKVGKKGPRSAVVPDLFRKMEKEQGPEVTLNALRKGAHLKGDGKGGYVGAPRTVDSPQALGALRRSLDEQFSDSVEAVQQADPTRVGTWYDRAKAAQAATNEPWQLPRSLEQHGVYSAGVAPETELAFALKHANSRALGEPTMAYRSAPMRNLDSAVAQDRPAKMGLKIGEYRDKNDPRIPNTGLFGVNDFRAAQGMHYTRPDGSIWKGGVSPTMHQVMDGETALVVDRANQAGIGGRTNWQGPHIQELPWVYGKGHDLYTRGSKGKGRFANMPPEEGMAAAVREANNTIGDFLYKHTLGGTYEYAPANSAKHVPEFKTWPVAQQDAYGEAGKWTRDDGLDKIYSALGVRQLPTREGRGAYTNMAGEVESNRMMMPRALASFATGDKTGRIAPNETAAFNAAERFRGLMDAQEAYAFNLPNTGKAAKGKNSLLFDARDGDPLEGAFPSAEILARVNKAMDPQGYALVPSNRGAVLTPYNQASKPRELNKVLKKNKALLEEVPGTPMKAITTAGYGPALGKWGEKGIVPTDPFSGQATIGLLEEFAAAPKAVARNLSEAEEIRSAIRDKTARDELLNFRRDIQNTRAFFSEADWNRAVEMIRGGMKPAAALAALGYSVNSLAAPQDQGR